MSMQDLVDMVRVDLPGCPDPTILDQLQRAARRFARDARVWIREIDRFEIQSPISEIDLFLPQDADLIELTSITIDGKPVAGQFDGSTLTLSEARSGLIVVSGAMEPRLKAKELPPELYRWREAIEDYARSRLMMMPNVEWANPDLGMAYRRQYQDQVTEARIERDRGRASQPLRVKPHAFL